tara:strand:+ start:2982 stop:4520 length:1539 start_codon:yes stop_codon:yes gene_type:complete
MARPSAAKLAQWHKTVASALTGPVAVAIVPALALGIFWSGGEFALMCFAIGLPTFYLIFSGVRSRTVRKQPDLALLSRAAFADHINDVRQRASEENRHAVIVTLEIEDFEPLTERYGQTAADVVVKRTGERLFAVLREPDKVAQMGDARFAICTAPVRHLDLETCIQLAARIQTAIEEPVAVDGISIYASVSIGFCQFARAPGTSGADWLRAASSALREAQVRGPAAIRAFSDQMRIDIETRKELCDDVVQALDAGQIFPWFQPQISTDTGEITGFEALARWHHPERGIILPKEFMPVLETAGLLGRLAEVMMYHTFAALKAWDGSGVEVPQVGVNFTSSELRNPRLTEKVKWELDRFDLTPDRLAVEILETVVASAPDDLITRNINALGAMGCRIDLDDFGTGHASITSIKRFSVSRIKIDRSFVMKADRDPEQQRMISAILTMAERLEVETLAEGVETVGEHVLLAQLGCDHVQGYGIARPMPFDQTLDWIARHNAKLSDAPRMMDGKSR